MTEKIKAADFAVLGLPKRRNKYNARKTVVDGIKFDSKKEAARYSQLEMLQAAGEISGLQLQVKIPLMGQSGPILTPKGRQAHYVADFVYYDHAIRSEVIEDVKGYRTKEFNLKMAILAAQGKRIILV